MVNPFPGKRYKRFNYAIINQLEAYLQGTPEEIIAQASSDLEVASFGEIVKKARIEFDIADKLLPALLEQGKIILIEKNSDKNDLNVFGSSKWYNEILESSRLILSKYHSQYPLRVGMPREELKSKLKVSQKIFSSLIEKWDQENLIKVGKSLLSLNSHQVIFVKSDQQKLDNLINIFEENPFSPPGIIECRQLVGDEVFNALMDREMFVQVLGDIVFQKKNYDDMLAYVLDKLNIDGKITVAQFRDRFQTSRKYALGFLEYLDSIGITFRDGDFRKLKPKRN
ncbi:MAG: hypothetical protein HGB14_01415 [Anaerolineaceae bacterium]|nr:hypothetical protein [Anaerolineaceae bacterium]